jgi:hypothetical protein
VENILIAFQPFDFEYNWLNSVRAAGDEYILILHPGAEIAFEHHHHQDLVNVIPGPVTLKTFWPLCQVFDRKLISHREKGAGSLMHVWPAVFLCQILVVEGFLYFNFTDRELICHQRM